VKPSLAVVATVLALSLAGASVQAREHPADVCLEVAGGTVSAEDWEAVSNAVREAIAERGALFPAPHLSRGDARIDIDSGHLDGGADAIGCLAPGSEWTARFGRAFLEAGADQMLAEAPTTPGIESNVSIEWHPDEARMRTTLTFAGPLDIPNGTCWIDDALSVDREAGIVVASGEQGVKTSPFAESACGRFFEHLPEGGAGEQAVTLLPRTVALPDGDELRFLAEDVVVADDAVSVSGRLERR
jgi:hypothetical protein